MVPKEAISKWEELGIELDLEDGDLELINDNVDQKANDKYALQMLRKWKKQQNEAATPEKLIKALQDLKQNSYAAELQEGIL